jgi:hypothetical protein
MVFLRGSMSILRRAADTSLTLNPVEAASTIFRFFRSNHVTDLRTIVRITTVLLLIYIISLFLFWIESFFTNTRTFSPILVPLFRSTVLYGHGPFLPLPRG